jgi:hypothetical protein
MSPQVSWLFFKAVRAGLAVKRPYLSHTGRTSNAEKQPTGRGPGGLRSKWAAAALLVGYVPHQFLITAAENRSGTIAKTGAGCALAPCRRPILNATASPLYARRCASLFYEVWHNDSGHLLDLPVTYETYSPRPVAVTSFTVVLFPRRAAAVQVTLIPPGSISTFNCSSLGRR